MERQRRGAAEFFWLRMLAAGRSKAATLSPEALASCDTGCALQGHRLCDPPSRQRATGRINSAARTPPVAIGSGSRRPAGCPNAAQPELSSVRLPLITVTLLR